MAVTSVSASAGVDHAWTKEMQVSVALECIMKPVGAVYVRELIPSVTDETDPAYKKSKSSVVGFGNYTS